MAEVPLPAGYVLVEKLGSGGFATVWLAEQGRLGRRVAVKVLGESLGDSERERRFLAECRAIGRLSGHPSVVTVHDAGTTDEGHPYLVMEHLPGGSLHDRVYRQGPLPWVEVLRIGVQVADALSAAHDAGILHRDVKPANVLVDENGSPKLGDFGIARLSEGTNTATGALVGTIPFTPPEVLSGHRPGPTADVWALGATLHALLSGTSPFGGHRDEPPAATIARVLRSEPPPLGPEVPAALRDLIFAMLAADPADRPQSAAAVVMALQVIQADRGLEVTPARVTRAAPTSEPRGQTDATAIGLPALDTPRSGTHPRTEGPADTTPTPTPPPPPPPPPVDASSPPPPPVLAKDAAPATVGPETWEPPGGPTPPPPPPPIAADDGTGATTGTRTWVPPEGSTPPPPPPIDPATSVLPGASDAAPGGGFADGGTAVLPAAGEGGTAVLPQAGPQGVVGAPPIGPAAGEPGAPPPPPPRRDGAGGRSKAPLFVGLAALVVLLLVAGAAFVLLGGGDDGDDGATGGTDGGTESTAGGDGEAEAPPADVTTNLGTPVTVPSGPASDPTQAWTTPAACSPPGVNKPSPCGVVAIDDDVVMLVAGEGSTATLRRVAADDQATERWSFPVEVGVGLGGLTRVGDTLMVSYDLDAATRRYQTYDMEGQPGASMDLPLDSRPALPNPQPAEGSIMVVLIDTGEVAVLDTTANTDVTVPGLVVASDAGTLWADLDGQLVAYDLPTPGEPRVVDGVDPAAIPAPDVPFQRSGVLAGGFLYVATADGVAVVDPESLAVLMVRPYQASDGSPLGEPLAVSSVGDLVLVATTGGAMAIEGPSQAVRWALPMDPPLLPDDEHGSVWIASGSRLVVGLPESGLQSVDLADGSIAGTLGPADVSASTVVPYQGGIAVLDKTTITGYRIDNLKQQWTGSVEPDVTNVVTTTGGLAVVGPSGIAGLTG